MVFGFDAADQYDVLQRRIGYLPGDFVAYPDLTGAQYLDYFAHLYGGVDRDRIELLAKRFDLDLGVRIGALSRGNRQKVGIVQAFMHEPDLLILDEPTTGLDPLDAARVPRPAPGDPRRRPDRLPLLARPVRGRGGRRHRRDPARRPAGDDQSVQALRDSARRRLDLTFAGTPPADRIHAVPGVQELTVDGRTAHVVGHRIDRGADQGRSRRTR